MDLARSTAVSELQTGYPLVLTRLTHVRCVVVGGGRVAERKVSELLASGAQACVISPSLTPALASWQAAGRIEHTPRGYQQGDLAGAFLAFAATDSPAVNASVAAEAAVHGILINVADDPGAGNFHTVACVRRGSLLLTVSTAGASPALSAQIRGELEQCYGNDMAWLLDLLRSLRHGPAQELLPQQRTLLWQRLTSEQVLSWVRKGQRARVWSYAQEQLGQLTQEPSSTTPRQSGGDHER